MTSATKTQLALDLDLAFAARDRELVEGMLGDELTLSSPSPLDWTCRTFRALLVPGSAEATR